MGRPTRKHPLIGHHESPEARTMLRHVVDVLGAYEYQAVDQVSNVTVYRLDGPRGPGLLADRTGPVADQLGVYASVVSVWVRTALHAESWALDARLYGWDAGTFATATGDRSLIDGPKRRMYQVRDERTAEVAKSDTLMVSELPADAVPGFTAGLTAETVRALAAKHAPELLA